MWEGILKSGLVPQRNYSGKELLRREGVRIDLIPDTALLSCRVLCENIGASSSGG